ncbi:oxidoreductase, partial [Mesorhizobium sp. M1A.F.Ca.IN.020.32.1.1]
HRTAADVPLRRILSRLNVNWLLEVSVAEWHGSGATVVDHNTGQQSFVDGDCLVLATTNMSANWLAQDLEAQGLSFHQIGDCAAPRQAPYAFYEGRKVALEL